jgi:very-short-patch-repair endonuclease
MTDAEHILWSKIKGKQLSGVQFYRQKPIGEYIVDFYSSSIRIVIELDGGQHFEPENIEKDRLRDDYLKSKGLRVLRFDNHEVIKNLSGVLDVIYKEIEKSVFNPPAA